TQPASPVVEGAVLGGEDEHRGYLCAGNQERRGGIPDDPRRCRGSGVRRIVRINRLTGAGGHDVSRQGYRYLQPQLGAVTGLESRAARDIVIQPEGPNSG